MPNKHIVEYIASYIESSQRPEYAVLIDGEWGSGKTHLIGEILKSITQKNSQIKIFKTSLYGIKSISDIESDFFRQAHPILSSKCAIFGKALGKAILKGALKIDFDNDKTEDITIEVKDLNGMISKEDIDTDEHVLVFDDLERCSMDIVELFGYINFFIETHKYKTILITNETVLKSLWSRSKNQNKTLTYEQIKEKLVGKTLHITPDIEEATQAFICKEPDNTIKNLYNKNKNNIIKIFKESQYDNMRYIRLALYDFSIAYNSLTEKICGNDNFIEHFFILFLVYKIESLHGKIHTGEINNSLIASRFISKTPSSDTAEGALQKYNTIDAFQPILDAHIWDYFIFTNQYICKKDIENSILQTKYFATNSEPAWKRLYNFYTISENEFIICYDEIIKKLNCLKITDPIELITTINTIFALYESDTIDVDIDSLLENAKKGIITNIDLESFCSGYQHITNKNIPSITHYIQHIRLHTIGDDRFFKFKSYLHKTILAVEEINSKKHAESLTDLMKLDPDSFTQQIAPTVDSTSEFCNKPILKFVDLNKFISSYISLDNFRKRIIVSAISIRYKENVKLIKEELDWIIGLQTEIKKHVELTYKKSINHIHFKDFLKTIDEIISLTKD